MELRITETMRDALSHAGHVPDDLRRRFDTMEKVPGSGPMLFLLKLSEDEAVELSELLQWHVRTDAATGKPTPETAPYAAIIQAIADQSF